MKLLNATALTCALLASGCVLGVDFSPAGRHEAFIATFGNEVGKDSTDPDASWIARYPKDIIGKKQLKDGNIEIEFRPTSYKDGCRVFYQVNPKSKIVVGWRYEGTVKQCWWNKAGA